MWYFKELSLLHSIIDAYKESVFMLVKKLISQTQKHPILYRHKESSRYTHTHTFAKITWSSLNRLTCIWWNRLRTLCVDVLKFNYARQEHLSIYLSAGGWGSEYKRHYNKCVLILRAQIWVLLHLKCQTVDQSQRVCLMWLISMSIYVKSHIF